MLIPIEWLKEYTKIPVDIDTFCERMIMSGSNLETVRYYGENLEKIVVGKILSVKDHEDSDHLLITQVDVGESEPLQVVTGAPNVREGILVPVALEGSVLPGGMKIKKGKLRGVESNGMLCSAKELAYDDKVVSVSHKDGIWVLPENLEVGTLVVDALDLTDAVVDFEITPNRPDCLSIVGMARESAATFGEDLYYPEGKSHHEHGKAAEFVDVEIKNSELCRRYIARIVTDVIIEESPWWIQKRLMHAGMRPINNIVDVTNYVMLEYGHPIHAFDIRMIEGGKIVVDVAKEGEKFTTLDETERTLTADMLLIKDAVKPVAIAGVMGGLNSEILPDTTTILIEAANFNADSVRKTSKKLGLRTEASSRYEKGVDANLSEDAANRVCYLIELIGAGKVVHGMVDEYPNKMKHNVVQARVDRINKVLGTELSRKDMEHMLKKLEIDVIGMGNIMEVVPPTVRLDILEEEDVIEEIARIYGYDKLDTTLPRGNSASIAPTGWHVREIAKRVLNGFGYNEVQTYSFMSPKGMDQIKAPMEGTARSFVKLINPLGEETSVMRTSLVPNMMEILARNYTRFNDRVRAFEIGNTFIRTEEKLPEEKSSLVIGAYGQDMDFFVMKRVVVEMFEKLGLAEPTFTAETCNETYHPGRCGKITIDEKQLGIMGEIHPDISREFGIDTRCYVAEIEFSEVITMADTMRYYHPLPKYPPIARDIALVVAEEVTVGDIEAEIWKTGSKILENVKLFDVYRGKQVEDGKKSVAFNLVYRAEDRTLTDEEVVKDHGKILDTLKAKLDAELR